LRNANSVNDVKGVAMSVAKNAEAQGIVVIVTMALLVVALVMDVVIFNVVTAMV
jgi:hypothetical protein